MVEILSETPTLEQLSSHGSWLRAYVRKLVESPSDAEDILQEVWLTILRSPPRHSANLRGWLAAVARSRARDHRRQKTSSENIRQKMEGQIQDLDCTESRDPSSLAHSALIRPDLLSAIGNLPGKYREIVELHLIDEQPFRIISSRLNLSLETARKRYLRGIRRLRQVLTARYGEAGAALGAGLMPVTQFRVGSLEFFSVRAIHRKHFLFTGLGILALLPVAIIWYVKQGGLNSSVENELQRAAMLSDSFQEAQLESSENVEKGHELSRIRVSSEFEVETEHKEDLRRTGSLPGSENYWVEFTFQAHDVMGAPVEGLSFSESGSKGNVTDSTGTTIIRTQPMKCVESNKPSQLIERRKRTKSKFYVRFKNSIIGNVHADHDVGSSRKYGYQIDLRNRAQGVVIDSNGHRIKGAVVLIFRRGFERPRLLKFMSRFRHLGAFRSWLEENSWHSWMSYMDGSELPLQAMTVTGEQGEFEFIGIPEGKWEIVGVIEERSDKRGILASASSELTISAACRENHLKLQLNGASHIRRIAGTVYLPDGNPAPRTQDIAVKCFDSKGVRVATAHLEAQGSFELTIKKPVVDPCLLFVTIDKSARDPDRLVFDHEPSLEMPDDLRLTLSECIVPGVMAGARNLEIHLQEAALFDVSIREEGGACIDTWQYSLFCAQPGFLGMHQDPYTPDNDDALSGGYSLRKIQSDDPVSIATRVTPFGFWFMDHGQVTDQGIFTLTVPRIPFYILVASEGFDPAFLGPIYAESYLKPVEIILKKHGRVRGRILKQEKPVAYAKVQLFRHCESHEVYVLNRAFTSNVSPAPIGNATADRNGYFDISIPKHGLYVLRVGEESGRSGKGASVPSVSEPFSFSSESERQEIIVRIKQPGKLVGRSLSKRSRRGRDEFDMGWYKAESIWISRGDAWPMRAHVNEQGEFEFPAVAPGTWRVNQKIYGRATYGDIQYLQVGSVRSMPMDHPGVEDTWYGTVSIEPGKTTYIELP